MIFAIPFCVVLYLMLGGMTVGLFDRHCCDETEAHTLFGAFWPVALVIWLLYALVTYPYKWARGGK